jgi:D-glycero-D-manno-heptose 1,7-bisphosphate phosphatase
MLALKAKNFRVSPTSLGAIFFDRDGVVNEVIETEGFRGPRNISEIVIENRIADVLELSKKANFLNVVVTNQPDVSRGYLSLENLQQVHNFLMNHLPCIDAIIVCIHDSSEGCACRKPSDGMLRMAAQEFNIDFSKSFMIGDRWVDIEAGRRAGVKTVLVERQYSWRPTGSGAAPDDLAPDFCVTEIDQLEQLVATVFNK